MKCFVFNVEVIFSFLCAFDMSKATQMGFNEYESTENVFLQLFEQLADQRIIPKWEQL